MMIYKPRLLTSRLRRLLAHFPVVIVSGARQVGKSTLLRRELPDWEIVVFDPAVDVGAARSDPDLFLDNHPAPLVLDEIQFAPELVPSLKRRVDRTREPGRYVLTGSQQWSVLKTASESLAGRAAFLDLEGFSLAEIARETTDEHWLARYLDDPRAFVARSAERVGTATTVYERLWRGFLPGSDALSDDLIPDFYGAYLRTYIERDVRVIADVGDWQAFGRFVRLAAALTAKEVNYSQLGREIGITPQTAHRWLSMLRATFQWFEVPAYHGNALKRVSRKPKGYIADTGLACNIQMISAARALGGHPMAGALFESAVVAEIRKLSGTLSSQPTLHHWRSHGGAEVDLLLERDGRLFPIEVKLTTNPTRADASGFGFLRETYPDMDIAPGLVIGPVERARTLNGVDLALPWDSR
jgi:predicted AAA+ superfamily ATPase